MKDNFRKVAARLNGSPVVWSWIFNGLLLASGVLLLPLLVKLLPKADFGMYYVFLSLSALVPILDFGLSASVGRAISYAMGGATELKAEGFVHAENAGGPNYALLWQLLHTTRLLFRWLSLIAFVLLSVFGSYMVSLHVHETSSPTVTWIGWGVTLLAALWELYAGWWSTFLRGMDKVLLCAQQNSLTYALRLVLACGLLLSGAGLLSVPLAGFLTAFLRRELARRSCLKLLGSPPSHFPHGQARELFAKLWPNSWKIGLQSLSNYLSTSGNMLICQAFFGLAAGAEYGLSTQLVGISIGMASVWTSVKWPAVGQYRTRKDYPGLHKMLRPRVWLQWLTCLGLIAGVIVVVPWLLHWLNSGKKVLPTPWLALLALTAALEMNYSFWGTLISTENRMPFVVPAIITNLSSLCLVLVLVNFTGLGLPSLVIAPFLMGSLYNYWHWPGAGARSIQTTWWQFMFSRPRG
jgi:O-antigen/teichoic acid export membrane protein